jgi:multicomponent Na+:H+ antiporter subunit F
MSPLDLVFGILAVALLLALVRFIAGPTLPDRVVALDTMAMIAIGIISTFAIARDSPDVLDVGVLLAFITFLGTVAFALYIEKRVR